MAPEIHEPEPSAAGVLLLQCLSLDAGSRAAALEDLCRDHPERAAMLRRLYGLLEGFGLADEPQATAMTPERLGAYRVLERIGQGGMGEVFLAEHETLGRRVALKLLPSGMAATPKARGRFRREAAAAARFDHPAICPIYEVGEHEGLPFLAMRYVPGQTLQKLIHDSRAAREQQMALPRQTGDSELGATLRLVERVALALHEAHEQGLVHRDVKPGNIMVTPAGEPVLLDFGLARFDDGEAHALTRTGDELGTPCYMAPEQILGRVADRRADVHALGVVLYECLTLRLPYDAINKHDLQSQIVRDEPPDPRSTRRDIGRDLWTVLQTALAKDPDRRYRTAAAFAEDVRRVRCREPILARRAGALLRARRWAQRQPALAVAIAGLLVALALTTLYLGESRRLLRHTRASALAREASLLLGTDQQLALLLVLEAVSLERTPATLAVLHTACAEARERAVFRHGAAVTSVAFADGRSVLSASLDKTARVWDLQGKELRSAVVHRAAVHRATLSVQGEVLTASADGVARGWRRGADPVELVGHRGPVVDSRFSPDGTIVLTASDDGTARLFEAASGRVLRSPIDDARLGLVSVAFAPGPTCRFLTASLDGKTRVYDGLAAALVTEIGEPSSVLSHAAFTHDGSILTGTPVLRGHDSGVRAVAWSPTGDRLVTVSEKGHVILWTEAGRKLRVLSEPPEDGECRILSATFRPDGLAVLTGAWDGTVRALDLEGRELWSHDCGGKARGRVNAVDCRPDGTFLTAHGDERAVRIWDSERSKLRELTGHDGEVTNAVFTSDGVLTASADGRARLFRTAGGDPLVLPHRARVMSAVESGDRQWLLTASSDGTAKIWDRLGTEVRTLPHDAGLTHATFSSDSQRILTACRDGVGRVWDLQGRLLAVFAGHRGVVWRAAFSPDGKRVVTGSFDHTARLWLTDPDRLLALARRRARQFTPAERERYAELLGEH